MKIKMFTLLMGLPLMATAHLSKELPNYGPGSLKGTSGQGIQIVPLSKMGLPASVKEEMLLQLKMKKQKGYFDTESPYAVELWELGHERKSRAGRKGTSAQDMPIKKRLSKIKLAFPYSKLPNIDPKDQIGFAPAGEWKNGWTGVKEFFNDRVLGTCVFTLNNVALSKGSVLLSKEMVNYEVNRKPTTFNIEGNPRDGFLYELAWYDDHFFYELECANKELNPKFKRWMREYGQRIDQSFNRK